MAGLIQKQMGPSSGADEQMEQEPVEGAGADGSEMHEGMEGEALEAEDQGTSPEGVSVFEQALSLAYEALYKNDAAKDVANQLKSAQSLSEGMADVAYNITSVLDERTDGEVPDELLGPLAISVLGEVSEIAEAAGLDPQPEDVADAFKQILLRFLGEQGVDTTQLQQAMDQVDPSVFRDAASGAKPAGDKTVAAEPAEMGA